MAVDPWGDMRLRTFRGGGRKRGQSGQEKERPPRSEGRRGAPHRAAATWCGAAMCARCPFPLPGWLGCCPHLPTQASLAGWLLALATRRDGTRTPLSNGPRRPADHLTTSAAAYDSDSF
nr:unnamed protein product [Digitaria exilis]